jgi:hypothetical protein
MARTTVKKKDKSRGGVLPFFSQEEGAEDFRKLVLAIGLPVPRILFDALIETAEAPDHLKKEWRQKVEQLSDVTETGCLSFEFKSQRLRGDEVYYVVLDECDPCHDLGEQLAKIDARAPDKRAEIRGRIADLVNLGRAAYSLMVHQAGAILREVMTAYRKAGGGDFDPQSLQVDPANTTLYLPALTCSRRVGVFVRSRQEVEAQARRKAAGTAAGGGGGGPSGYAPAAGEGPPADD